MKVWVAQELQAFVPDTQEQCFEWGMSLQGDTRRKVERRHTSRFELGGQGYFVKQHFGTSVTEILEDLLRGRKPVVGAMNEVRQIEAVTALNISTTPLRGWGTNERWGVNERSFMLTEALPSSWALDRVHPDRTLGVISIALKRKMVVSVAKISRDLHQAGINHRDLYLNHFRILERDIVENPTGNLTLYLMDLHRAQQRNKVPTRWLVKDLGSLYFSTFDSSFTQRDCYRFLKIYFGKPLRQIFREHQKLLAAVARRADKMQQRHTRKNA